MSNPVVTDIPFVPWEEFLLWFSGEWRQSEHVAMIGPTGQGKTTLATHILPIRKYRVVIGTKPADDNLDRFVNAFGYTKMEQWPKGRKDNPAKTPRRLIWPRARALHSDGYQREVILNALEQVYLQGGWCVYLDELWYISVALNLAKEVKTYLLQARSLNIALVAATQRPAWVPLEVYDQSTHLFFWGDTDEANVNRISGIGGLDTNLVRATIRNLDPHRHEVLYMNTRQRVMYRTIPPNIV